MAITISIICILSFAAYLTYIGLSRIREKKIVFNEKINVKWWGIGLSVFATDVSLSYIVNTSGIGFTKGLAVGSYGWTSILILIAFAIYILPKYMRLGIQTLPEYLEIRFSPYLRLLVAIVFILTVVLVSLSFIYYSFGVLIISALGIDHHWQLPIIAFIGIFSGLFLFAGGLKAGIKFDTFVAVLILVVGVLIFSFAVHAVGGFDHLAEKAKGRLNIFLPINDNFLPWTQVVFGGIWLLHLNFWAFYQPIAQKVINAESLSQAQKGLLLTASLKLVVPFMVLIPGIICYELYSTQVTQPDDVFPVVLKNIFPHALSPVIVLALGITVISSSYANLHAAALMFTNDIFGRFINPKASEILKEKVYFIAVFISIVCAIVMAPYISQNETMAYIGQIIRFGFLPGIIVIFLMGLFHYRSYAPHAWLAFGVSIILFFITKYYFPKWITLEVLGSNAVVIAFMFIIFSLIMPSPKSIMLLGKREIRFERNLEVVLWSMFLITCLFAIYVIFI